MRHLLLASVATVVLSFVFYGEDISALTAAAGQQLDFCSPNNPCQNGGACYSAGNQSGYCACPTGFFGQYCEQAVVDVCTPNPCQNGGYCSSYSGGNSTPQAVCYCGVGYSGQYCEFAVATSVRGTSKDDDGGQGRCDRFGWAVGVQAGRWRTLPAGEDPERQRYFAARVDPDAATVVDALYAGGDDGLGAALAAAQALPENRRAAAAKIMVDLLFVHVDSMNLPIGWGELGLLNTGG